MTPKPLVLVLEDEALIAHDTAMVLQQAGFEVLGPALSNLEAAKLLAEACPAVAVIDVNLVKETSAPVATELRRRGIPFIGVTGYNDLPPEFASAPRLGKPFAPAQLILAVKRLLER